MADRRAAYRLGHMAEYVAIIVLSCKRHRILAHRYRTPVGEIDLIARRGTHFAFVEVKARGDRPAGGEVLSSRQAGRIRRAAEFWLARQEQSGVLPPDWSASLDLITIRPWCLPQHLRDVF